ncbi:CocE/NonD family hydrolase [Conexibacter sp. SYSU D00693]|uniref:CocE/NonD family hydrolase n=1 Tax=Conexibacter sp. SYSU D00693 TaxID=2812560 RepID=UPI00196A3607|nr:CocE/NonD family hydrolase [Conexibacter sp. SYSU D00693]
MLRRLVCCIGLVLAGLASVPAAAHAGFSTPPGATWTQGFIRQADGTTLHYDLLRPKGLPKDARTPVIVSIGPYFGHAGQTGPAGPVEGTSYDPLGTPGPSDRFRDVVEGAKLMERGYAFLMVDLRGFGGSNGCLDWGGPGEQADVKAAVEWAASQPWSTGKVGMYGKSYDGVTGLIGGVSNPKGLAAVVSQEPVYDLYRYLYADGVRYTNSLLTPALYIAIDATGFALQDSSQVLLNNAGSVACYPGDYLAQQSDVHDAPFWKARDLIRRAPAAKVPLLLTQGFLENNTKPDGSFDFFSAYGGPKRAWFGMWDHVRGNDVDAEGKLKMGRQGWFDEVMRFFDHHVRDVPLVDAPVDRDPPVVVQSSDGGWRAEPAWPPADATDVVAPLRDGSYVDDAMNAGTSEVAAQGLLAGRGRGVWTVSPPLPHAAHLAGVPRFSADVAVSRPFANLVVDLYDVDPAGSATLVSRNARRIDRSGRHDLALYGNDWKLPAGHRIGVLVTGSNMDWWLHVPTLQTVRVRGATLRLPFLRHTREAALPGEPAERLKAYRERAPFTVDGETLAAATDAAFPVPPAQTPPPAAAATSARPKRAATPRLVVRLSRRSTRRVVVHGTAPTGFRVRIAVRQGTRTIGRRTVTAKVGAFRATVRVRPRGRGRVRAHVTATRGRTVLRARSAALVLRRR